MNKELEDKKKRLEALRIEVCRLEQKERKERIYPDMKKWEGTFWKYKNTIIGSDWWWLYRYIKEVRPDGLLVVMEFEVDRDGEIKIGIDRRLPWESFTRLGEGCGPQEWGDALVGVRDAVRILENAGE